VNGQNEFFLARRSFGQGGTMKIHEGEKNERKLQKHRVGSSKLASI
jgi:hypothetical protein